MFNEIFGQYRILSYIFSLTIFIVNYAFKAVGLYRIAGRKNLALKWLAFIPFANTYLLGKITGEINLFTGKIKNAALFVMLAEIAYFVFYVAYTVMINMPYINAVLAGEYTVFDLLTGNFQQIVVDAGMGVQIVGSLFNLFNLAYILLFISLLLTFFRNFTRQNAFLFAILSVFLNIEGIFIFVVRNNEEIDYMSEMRARYGQNRPSNPYNPYDRSGTNSEGTAHYHRPPSQDPFEEFTEVSKKSIDDDVPFKEFDSDSDKGGEK